MLLDLARPGVFPPEIRATTTALACSLPRTQNLPLARHSSTSLARQLVELKSVVKISAATVRRWLQTEKLKPWRFKLWQHITEPKSFLQKAKVVLRLYQHAAALLKRGIWVVCADEKTSIQARLPELATRPAQAEQPTLLAARYKRQGAVQLFAG